MISLIICSTSSDLSPELESNIEDTIGVAYELVVIDNSTNQHSIFEAYNLGLARSQYQISCFMHDDILYRTENWGRKAVRHFEDSKTGMIGIAGTKYIGRVPAFWSDYTDYNEHNLIQNDRKRRTERHEVLSDKNGTNLATDVAMVDGVWFCVYDMKERGLRFDESYGGFHFYDLDTCFQVREKGYAVKMVYNVLIEHFSVGSIGPEWTDNAFKCYHKWQGDLPARTTEINSGMMRAFDRQALKKLIKIVDHYKTYQHLPAVAAYAVKAFGSGGLALLFNYRRVFWRGYKSRK